MIDQCKKCNGTFSHLYHQNGEGWLCRGCFDAPPERYNSTMKMLWHDQPGAISVGHVEDIKRRAYDFKTGEVTRSYGKKYFTR